MRSDAPELILMRHAPADHGGCLVGRTDVPVADLSRASGLQAVLPRPARVICSPALRCRQTAMAVMPDFAPTEDPLLWEQDFGVEDGVPFDQLPDLGTLTSDALAARVPPNGESFLQMADRVAACLGRVAEATGPTLVVAHAGTVRAALGLALGHVPLGLRFAVAPLSVTRLAPHPDGWAILSVNWSPA